MLPEQKIGISTSSSISGGRISGGNSELFKHAVLTEWSA